MFINKMKAIIDQHFDEVASAQILPGPPRVLQLSIDDVTITLDDECNVVEAAAPTFEAAPAPPPTPAPRVSSQDED
jgi:hypothetical protein